MDRFNPMTWEEWRQNPLTAVFLRYLRDQSETLAKQWQQGQEMSPKQQTKAFLLMELSELTYEDYAAFYKVEQTDQPVVGR